MSRSIHPTAAALIGIGVRLPGGTGPDVRGPAQAWKALKTGTSAITRYPDQRWKQMQERLHPDDRTEQPWPVAHLSLPEPGSLDTSVFGLRSVEGRHLSPTQTLIMQVGAEAVADAGIAPSALAGPRTGLYVGASTPDEALNAFADGARPSLAGLGAGGAGMLATPLSRWWDSRGPLVTFDTSCSASMYALDAARRDLASGRVDTAVVIGTNTCANPVISRAFVEGGVLAEDGRCLPYDVDAHGYVRGEATVVVVLRRYAQARRGQDRVYAVIDHTVVGADGRSAGTGMPSARAQADLIARTYAEADVHPDAVGYVIGHGTATSAGDSAETRALAKVFARPDHDRLLLGSVKGLWGHAEAAAGLCGVIAGALTLHHGQIPTTVGHSSPPQRWAEHGPQAPTALTCWPERGLPVPSYVGVSALGFSGAIAHTILRGVPIRAQGKRGNDRTGASRGGAVVLPLAAPTDGGLHAAAQALAPALSGPQRPRPGRAGDHLARRHDHQGVRAAVVATGHAPRMGEAFAALAQGRPHPDVVGPTHAEPGEWAQVWVFGGHGAAYPAMGRTLYLSDELFAAHLDQVREVLAGQAYAAHPCHPWHPAHHPAQGLAATQQATFSVQVALARTLTDRWGLTPQAVVGHSLGEVAAAHTAGILSLEDAARLVCARSALLERVAGQGGLVAARLDVATALEVAELHRVEVACYNSPTDIVFSGGEAALDDLVPDLDHRGAKPRRLDAAPPAHSRYVEPVLDDLAAALHGLSPRTGHVSMVSTVTGATVAGAELNGAYWVRQLREPVRLEQAITTLARRGPTLATELSPQPVLGGALARTRARHHLDLDVAAAGDAQDEARGMAAAAAAAYTHGQNVRWPYPPCAPVDAEPAPWTPTAPDRWVERIAALAGDERRAALLEVVHTAVADLAARPISAQDLDTDLDDLGVNSLHRISLRASLLAPFPDRPRDLPEHQPTIASIAQALDQLLPVTAHPV